MSHVARVTQISARSQTGIEDAVHAGLQRASRTLRGISGVWVKDIKADVDETGAVSAWQVFMELTFVLDDE
jgi:flavin-binding protein dodecin